MQAQTRQKLARELLFWFQYFVIALMTSVIAYDFHVTKRYGPPVEGVDVNLMGLFRAMWSTYLLPWLIIFFAFCMLRFLFIILAHYFSRTSQKKVEVSADN